MSEMTGRNFVLYRKNASEEEIKKYTERFAEPEDIPQEEVSNHLGFRMMFW